MAVKDVVLRPGAAVSISEPMKNDTKYVGVVALFREAGKDAVWKLAIPKAQWKKTDPMKIEVRDNMLELGGSESIKRTAAQQS